jgi:4-diphosphocytidyl-2-C-methyl-D-erythritol kinase
MTGGRRIRVRCPAKINLHLEVRGRRPDGYHELRSLLVAIGIWDELVCEPAGEGSLDLTVLPEGAVESGESNLVIRAARALQRRYGARLGARLTLTKGIPVAGGLGGGSSDAAGALVGLSRLWGLADTFADLHPLAADLGSDVPYFLVGGAAWAVGRGSEVFPLGDLPAWRVVLLAGEEPVSTARVYAQLGAGPVTEGGDAALYHWVVAGGALPLPSCRNDLEPTVLRLSSDVAARLAAVRDTRPLLALVSGSGGSVFGLYADEAAAVTAAGNLSAYRPRIAPLLGRIGSTPEATVVED